MSKTELALIKKIYKKVQELEKELALAREEIQRLQTYKIIDSPTRPVYPQYPAEPLRPYFDNPLDPTYRGPWMCSQNTRLCKKEDIK